MESFEDLQQIHNFDHYITSAGNNTTPILALTTRGRANSCQQTLSKTFISLNGAACSDSLTSCVSRRIKGWIYHLTYDPILMILATACCLCTASHYQENASVRVSLVIASFYRPLLVSVKEAGIKQ